MLDDFINLLKEQSDMNPERKFYISEVLDDRLCITIFEQVGISSVGRFLYEYIETIEVTDTTINNFITGYYWATFDEWYTTHYLKTK